VPADLTSEAPAGPPADLIPFRDPGRAPCRGGCRCLPWWPRSWCCRPERCTGRVVRPGRACRTSVPQLDLADRPAHRPPTHLHHGHRCTGYPPTPPSAPGAHRRTPARSPHLHGL